MTGRMAGALLFVAPLVITTGSLGANLPRVLFTANLASGSSAIAVDARGNTYLTGSVTGNPFTATPGAFQIKNAGGACVGSGPVIGPPPPGSCHNAYVIKLDPLGTVILATYLGGSWDAAPTAVAVDAQENIYVAGILNPSVPSDTPPFPLTPGSAFSSGTSFVVKLNPAGGQLLYSTLIPGATLSSIAVDGPGNLHFTGGGTGQFPATAGAYQASYPAIANAYIDTRTVVGKLNAAGSSLLFGTFLSGSLGPSSGAGIAFDATGNVLVAGTNFGADGAVGHTSAFLAKLNSDASKLIYTTQFGNASASAMRANLRGDVYLECTAAASDFPVIGAGFSIAPPATFPVGAFPNFLVHAKADDSSVLSSIYLPFTVIQPAGLDVDPTGNAYLAGTIFAPDSLQTSAGAFQSTYGGGADDSVIAKITPDGQVAGVTYFGGPGNDSATAIAAMRDGSVTVSGSTQIPAGALSASFPGAAQPFTATTFWAANLFPAIALENSASYVAGPLAPGEMVSIRSYGIGPVLGVASSPVTALGGVQVYFDNFPAPITYAQDQQINVQAPYEIAGQTATQVRIVFNGTEVGRSSTPVSAGAPGVLYIINSDGLLNSPSHPVARGNFISIFGTGGGVANPAGSTGAAWPMSPLSFLQQPYSAAVSGATATVIYAGSAPGQTSGLFQINMRLPQDLTGMQQVSVTIGGVTSVLMAIWIQ